MISVEYGGVPLILDWILQSYLIPYVDLWAKNLNREDGDKSMISFT